MKELTSFVIFLLLFLSSAFAQPRSATKILNEANAQAAKEKKNVFLIFHASWCGWCHKMDSSINDPDCKTFFDANYITTHLVVKESKDKEHLENPGALELMRKYNGDQSSCSPILKCGRKGQALMLPDKV